MTTKAKEQESILKRFQTKEKAQEAAKAALGAKVRAQRDKKGHQWIVYL